MTYCTTRIFATMMFRPLFLVGLAFSGLWSAVESERQYSQVIFSAVKCAELGYASEFDVCAVLEFCGSGGGESGEQRRRAMRNSENRFLRKSRELQDNELWWDDAFQPEEPEEEEEIEEPVFERPAVEEPAVEEPVVGGPVIDTTHHGTFQEAMQETGSFLDFDTIAGKEKPGYEEDDAEEQGGEAVDNPGVVEEDPPDMQLPPTNGEEPQMPPVQDEEPATPPADDQEQEPIVKLPPMQGPQDSVQGDLNVNAAAYGWRIPGTSECSYPGPILRMQQGLKHGLIVQSAVQDDSVVTNLHFHGLHIAGHGNGDDVHRALPKGASIVYALDLTNHMGGTYWYHSHFTGQSLQQTEGGAFGMIVVEENPQAHPVGTNDPQVLDFLTNNEKILVLDDTKNRQWVANGLNGRESFELVKNQWYRMRIMVVSVNPHSSGGILTFGNAGDTPCTVHAVAHDGILRRRVPKMEAQTEFPLTSSSRLDVAIRCQEEGTVPISMNHSPVADIRVVSGQSNSAATPFENQQPWQSTRLFYVQDMTLSATSVDNTWTVRVDETNLNGIGYSSQTPLCSGNEDFMFGSVQEWTLEGTSTHPFHVHTYPMQVVSGCGDYHEDGEFYDTILATTVRHPNDPSSSHRSSHHDCKVRLRLVDVGGPILVHCHIFLHAEHGAMGWFNVVNGPVQANEPRVHSCPTNMLCDPIADPAPLCSSG